VITSDVLPRVQRTAMMAATNGASAAMGVGGERGSKDRHRGATEEERTVQLDKARPGPFLPRLP
jgi:hypothetical protein